ncbi:hypothetical protein NSK_000147 [Nannochloropsis salina CCMP1776]|uniref:EF-hand domain-containing protein n=1 Tax=Nannochloropsis salina CCMP1776 TaxID=1027361 RepID=A0A4D9DEJ2_9STRA|nr:hypothetical protein NSK_000147 [Nannochloropsis salina CCMP1776]|eukprot:TFJ88573.1 hypothetical protein NSK_000147 [Nannochloropsis salina CCMP1776]
MGREVGDAEARKRQSRARSVHVTDFPAIRLYQQERPFLHSVIMRRSPSAKRQGDKGSAGVADSVRQGLTDEEIEEIREAFNLFDLQGSGTIDVRELKQAMQSLGFDSKNHTIYQMIADMESDNASSESNNIDFDEFLHMMTVKMSDKESKEDIEKVFNMFDDKGKGSISFKDLKRVAKELGENMSDAELKEMIQRADADQDGEVSFEDFYTIMTRRSLS